MLLTPHPRAHQCLRLGHAKNAQTYSFVSA